LAELFAPGQVAFKYVNGKLVPVAPVAGHEDHVHAAFRDAQSTLRAIKIAQRLGLSVRENPYTDRVDPVHKGKSYHYRNFPGLYGGKRLGEAIDVSGAMPLMNRYSRLLRGLGRM
jgi:hypothetical protein